MSFLFAAADEAALSFSGRCGTGLGFQLTSRLYNSRGVLFFLEGDLIYLVYMLEKQALLIVINKLTCVSNLNVVVIHNVFYNDFTTCCT